MITNTRWDRAYWPQCKVVSLTAGVHLCRSPSASTRRLKFSAVTTVSFRFYQHESLWISRLHRLHTDLASIYLSAIRNWFFFHFLSCTITHKLLPFFTCSQQLVHVRNAATFCLLVVGFDLFFRSVICEWLIRKERFHQRVKLPFNQSHVWKPL